jgi:hypothetical protein
MPMRAEHGSVEAGPVSRHGKGSTMCVRSDVPKDRFEQAARAGHELAALRLAVAVYPRSERTALNYLHYSAAHAPRARQAWGAAADYSLERHHQWTEAEAATLARLRVASAQLDAPVLDSACGSTAANDTEVAELLRQMKHAAGRLCANDYARMWGRIDRYAISTKVMVRIMRMRGTNHGQEGIRIMGTRYEYCGHAPAGSAASRGAVLFAQRRERRDQPCAADQVDSRTTLPPARTGPTQLAQHVAAFRTARAVRADAQRQVRARCPRSRRQHSAGRCDRAAVRDDRQLLSEAH